MRGTQSICKCNRCKNGQLAEQANNADGLGYKCSESRKVTDGSNRVDVCGYNKTDGFWKTSRTCSRKHVAAMAQELFDVKIEVVH